MSSTDPPQINIPLPSNTTSFKRSFEQYGFDLDSPVDTSLSTASSSASGSHDSPVAGSVNDSGERSKRARSDSFSSDSVGTSSSSQRVSASSSRMTSLSGHASNSNVRSPARSAPCPIPVPNDLSSSSPPHPLSNEVLSESSDMDIDMADVAPQLEDRSARPRADWTAAGSSSSAGSEYSEQFRLSMERFSAFDSEISSLRQRQSSPAPARAASPPPILPPLALPSPNLEGGRTRDRPVSLLPHRPPSTHTLPSIFSASSSQPYDPPRLSLSSTSSTPVDEPLPGHRFPLDLSEGPSASRSDASPVPTYHTQSPPLPRASPDVPSSRASQLAESRRRLQNLLGPPPQPPRSRLTQPSDPRPFLPSLDFEEARDSFWSDLDDDASESGPYHQLRDELRRRISNRERRAAAALETNFGLRTAMENEREHRRSVSRSIEARQPRSDNLWDFLDSTEVGGPGRAPSPNDRSRMEVDDFDEDWRRFREEIRRPLDALSHGPHVPPAPSNASRSAHEDDRRPSNAGRDMGGITIVEVGASGDPIRPPIDYSPRLRGADLDLFSDLNLIPANSSGTNNLDFLFSSEEAQPLLPTGDGHGRPSTAAERVSSRSGYGYPTTRSRPSSFASRYPDTSRAMDDNLDPTLARLSSELLRGNYDDLRAHWEPGPRRPSPPSRNEASQLNTRTGDPYYRVQNSSGSDNEAPTFSSLLPEIETGSPLLFDRHEPPVSEHRDLPPGWTGPGSTRTPSTASWRQYYNSSLYERTVMSEEGGIRPRYPPRPADQPSNRPSSTSLSEVPTLSLSRWDRTTSSDDPVNILSARRSWDWMNEDIPPPTPRYPWRAEIPRPPSPESTESSFALRSRLMEMRRASAATARVRLARSAHLANRASSPSSMSAIPRGRRGEDVPFSSEAAALFASRSTSPPPSGGFGDLSGGEEPRGRDGHRSMSSMYAPPPSVGISTAPTWHRPSSGSLHGPQELPLPSSMAFRRRPNAQGPTTDGPHEHSAPPSSSVFGRGMPPRLEELPMPSRRPARASERERSTVDSARDRPPSGAYRNIDLDAYHEGPFRASLERLVEIDRLRARREALLTNNDPPRRSRPPTIPPLQFDSDHEVWPFGNRPAPVSGASVISSSRLHGGHEDARPLSSGHHPRFHSPGPDNVPHPPRPMYRHQPPPPEHIHAHRRSPSLASFAAASRAEHNDARERRQMHTLFSRRTRMEGSRISGDDASPTEGEEDGFSQAMALLRADGRQQQLIDRFQRERSTERRRSSLQWGDIEGEHDAPEPPRAEQRRRSALSGFAGFSSGFLEPVSDNENSARARRYRLPSLRTAAQAARENGPGARERIERMIARTGRGRDMPLMFGYGPGSLRTGRPGDFMRDEDFDGSYENLVTLAATLGDVKPRCTPDNVIAALPRGTYQEWATPDCDQRCPICLDDYKPTDPVTRLTDCSHWLHQECLEQWLRSATTCPVCRHQVRGPRMDSQQSASSSSAAAGPSSSRLELDDDDDDDDEEDELMGMPPWTSPWTYPPPDHDDD